MKTILLACLLLLNALPAAGQGRMFPHDAPRGYLSPIPGKGERMLLNGKEIVLSTGIQIRDTSNVIIFSTMVKPESAVKYQLDGNYLHRAWILTPREIAAPDKYKLPDKDVPEILPAPAPPKNKDKNKNKDDEDDE